MISSAAPRGESAERQDGAVHLPAGSSRPYQVGVAAAITLGVAVRAAHVLRHPFPLNDGGMFYAMTRDLQAAHYRLPDVTSYNGAGIPFAYPPFGFYVAALLNDLTPLGLFSIFRFVPLVATCLTLVAFFLLARGLLPRRDAVVASVFAFALIPRSAIWLLMGGGLTRAFGFMFALFAMRQVHQMYVHRSWRRLPGALILSVLTVLSHVETGWFLAFSIGLFWLAYGRNRQGALASLALAGGVLALSAPWWATVVSHHGIGPFLAANSSGGSVFSSGHVRTDVLLATLRLVSTSEPFFPLLGTLGLLGVVAALASGRWLLPVWWLSIILLEARAFPTFTTAPVAMLAGIGLTEVLLPAVSRLAGGNGASPRAATRFRWSDRLLGGARSASGPVIVVGALLLCYTVPAALITKPGFAGESAYLVSLSREERDAMRWVAEETPPSSRFLLVTGEGWASDRNSEWFPVLAERESVATVQGTEWLPHQSYAIHVRAFDEAHECGYRTAECLEQWSADSRATFDYVYIPRTRAGQCCWTLVTSLRADPNYSLVYDEDGATIFSRHPSGEVRSHATTRVP